MVLESWYDTKRVVQRYSRNLRHNSREFPTGCSWVTNSPEGGRGLVLHQTLVVVLEAWCYTRAAGTEVIHVAATGFQGIPDCIALYNSPRMWRRLAQYQRLLGASISKGRWRQYQGSMVDGKRLVYWCSKLFTFLYFGHLFVYEPGYCLNLFIILPLIVCLYSHVDLFIKSDCPTNAPVEVSVCLAGIPRLSGCVGVFWRAS